MDDLKHVTIFTDGACDPNPGPGGWAAILKFGRHEKVISGSERQTTNNRMELTAAIQALHALTQSYKIDFFTDSEYLKKGITEWMRSWKARQWRRKGGKLSNVDLWQDLDAAIKPHEIRWNWVRAHAGNRNNQRVDRLAKQAISRA